MCEMYPVNIISKKWPGLCEIVGFNNEKLIKGWKMANKTLLQVYVQLNQHEGGRIALKLILIVN